jgi:hypothetical protein
MTATPANEGPVETKNVIGSPDVDARVAGLLTATRLALHVARDRDVAGFDPLLLDCRDDVALVSEIYRMLIRIGIPLRYIRAFMVSGLLVTVDNALLLDDDDRQLWVSMLQLVDATHGE